MAIANGSCFYTPPANIVRMAAELAYLPAYFTEPGDGILVGEPLSDDFLHSRLQLFGLSPEIIPLGDAERIAPYSIEPWGISPRFYHLFKDFTPNIWQDDLKELYSRKTAKVCLENLCKELDFVDCGIVPQVCNSIDELRALAKNENLVIKSPWSSSGKGQLRIAGGVTPKEEEWLKGILTKQGYFMVERLLDKKLDFAMQFLADGTGGVSYVGYSMFETGNTGTYAGNYAWSQKEIETRLKEYVDIIWLNAVRSTLQSVIVKQLNGYKGYIGVDMMIYTDTSGNYCLQPCVEINLRYNMGLLASILYERFIAPGSQGFFNIRYFPKKGDALKYSVECTEHDPIKMKEGKLIQGWINLTPVTEETGFIAEMKVQSLAPFF